MKDLLEGAVPLPYSEPCFVCGKDNPAGLQTRFYARGDKVLSPLRVRNHHCGYPNVVHGGVVAALMDEAMGWAAARAQQRMFYTVELTMRYIKTVPADHDLVVVTEVTRAHKRMVETRGELVDAEGTVYARATGKFFPLSVEATLEVDDHLVYEEGMERVFDSLRKSISRENAES